AALAAAALAAAALAAVALAAAGMHVILSGRRVEPLEAVASQIGDNAWIQPLDVSDKDMVNSVAKAILEKYGRCDVLVNSAGLNVNKRNWHNVTLDDWDRVIRIDLDGAFYCSQAVLPTMIEQQDGLIINISSMAGRRTSTLTGPAYCAAKHAMNAMTESLNMEAGIHGIRACAICPGEVDTPILEKRPVPVSADDRATMLQSEDCGAVIGFIAALPSHVCINELSITPTWNRGYVNNAKAIQSL
ncbi:MAG: SDR family oxidoreductase, partial [Chloroflexota bacterium]